ncbi:MAG: Flp pilus assembly complex ATPase component TadA [Parcubacteria group bacterium]|nr:Flp pilus assembly complex ATPase component TadA [Parcubacteria group bacterium]
MPDASAQQPTPPPTPPQAEPSPHAPVPSQTETASASESAADILHFEKWLGMLGSRKATDLHLSVGTVPALRVDGAIAPLLEEGVITAERIERIAEQLLGAPELSELRQKKQLVVSKTLKKSMRFRIHFFYSRGFLGISMRHVPDASAPLASLPHASLLAPLVSATQGLFIISGPFDSGRTSTVRSLLSEINASRPCYVVTLEAPIEYLLPSDQSVVAQREVGRDVESFAAGVAALAEEDVDVVVLSAIPDKAALAGALELATSGRLVVAVMEGNHTVAVLERLRDLSGEEDRVRILHELGDALIGITTQLLLPKIGGGRILVASAMAATHPIKSLVREGKFEQIPNIMQTSREQGMVTMDKALSEAVRTGAVSLATAKEYAVDINQFNALASH